MCRWADGDLGHYRRKATSGRVRTEMERSTLPASLVGPLSMLPPKPAASQKGGALWASQWQLFLLLHTCKQRLAVCYTLHWHFFSPTYNSIKRHLYSKQLNSRCTRCMGLSEKNKMNPELVYFSHSVIRRDFQCKGTMALHESHNGFNMCMGESIP